MKKPVLTRTPSRMDLTLLCREAEAALRPQPRGIGLSALAWRLLDAVIGLWVSNAHLIQRHREIKQENETLYHVLATLVAQQGGGIRLSQEQFEATPTDRRIRGYAIPGSQDVIFRLSDEETLVSRGPAWLKAALNGKFIPSLTWGDRQLLPVFDVTDHDATTALGAGVQADRSSLSIPPRSEGRS